MARSAQYSTFWNGRTAHSPSLPLPLYLLSGSASLLCLSIFSSIFSLCLSIFSLSLSLCFCLCLCLCLSVYLSRHNLVAVLLSCFTWLTARARREGLKSNFHKLRDQVPCQTHSFTLLLPPLPHPPSLLVYNIQPHSPSSCTISYHHSQRRRTIFNIQPPFTKQHHNTPHHPPSSCIISNDH